MKKIQQISEATSYNPGQRFIFQTYVNAAGDKDLVAADETLYADIQKMFEVKGKLSSGQITEYIQQRFLDGDSYADAQKLEAISSAFKLDISDIDRDLNGKTLSNNLSQVVNRLVKVDGLSGKEVDIRDLIGGAFAQANVPGGIDSKQFSQLLGVLRSKSEYAAPDFVIKGVFDRIAKLGGIGPLIQHMYTNHVFMLDSGQLRGLQNALEINFDSGKWADLLNAARKETQEKYKNGKYPIKKDEVAFDILTSKLNALASGARNFTSFKNLYRIS